MSKMLATVYTLEHIGEKEVAERFLSILDDKQLAPKTIGLYEPLKLAYTLDGAVNIWTQERDGCYVEGIGMTGKAGSLIGKTKEPQFRFDINWWRSSNKVYLNYIDFHFPVKTFKNYRESIESIFKEIIMLVNPVYGYITHHIPLDRQHVTGTLETRLPGVFWCNYFGQKYIEFLSEDKIVSFPWYGLEKLENGGFISYLAKEPDKDLVKKDNLEMQAKAHLGIDSFGDVEAYKENPDVIQMKNVPKF